MPRIPKEQYPKSFEDFRSILEKNFVGNRVFETGDDVYYWNLWNDSVKVDVKSGHAPDIDYFISLISNGDI